MKTTNDRVYFLGIGGIGMSALARYFHRQGMMVYGYDAGRTPLTIQLEAEGIHIHYVADIKQIPDNVSRVVYTPAIPKSNVELQYFRSSGMKMEKRAAVIGEISRDLFTVAIAGTHGKTSITAMVAQIFHVARLSMVAFIGGLAKNFGSNFVFSEKPKFMVVEADEFDRSFLTLHPDIAVVTSMDADHLDIYSGLEDLQNTFLQFSRLLPPDGKLIHHVALKTFENEATNGMTYGLSGGAMLQAANVRVENERFCFDVLMDGQTLMSLGIIVPGEHYVENTLAAVGAALAAGVEVPVIKKALEQFAGVQRRFDYRIRTDKKIYIDDYAHHPKELQATIQTVRRYYPDKELTVVFQPHLYTRTRDFADDFAKVLSQVDRLILLDIFPAREKPIPGVTSWTIADRVTIDKKYVMDKKELLAYLKKEKPELLLTLGAGNIGRMTNQIKEILTEI